MSGIVPFKLLFKMIRIFISILYFLVSNFCGYSQIKINYLDYPPKIDGKTNEWKTPFYEFKQTSQQAISPNFLKYQFGFDETYLYGVFLIQDKHITDLANDKSGSPRITFNDGIEFYIDTQNNSKKLMDDDDYQVIVDFQGNSTVFRGDKFLMKVEKFIVPKDTITNRFVMDYATSFEGTVNDNSDKDEGFMIEFRIAWATLGVRVNEHKNFKIDVCLNDADKYLDIKPLAESDSITNFSFQSINNNSDFGFPNTWKLAHLFGEASAWKKFQIRFAKWLIPLLIFVFIISTLLIIRHLQRRKQTVIVKEKIYQVIGSDSIIENSLQEKSKTLILQNLDKDFSPTELAQNLNVSLRQIQRQYKEELNTTPSEFIKKIKLEESAKLLVSSNLTISEIAYSVGFTDPAYYSSSFKKQFNQTPTEFQQNAQKI